MLQRAHPWRGEPCFQEALRRGRSARNRYATATGVQREAGTHERHKDQPPADRTYTGRSPPPSSAGLVRLLRARFGRTLVRGLRRRFAFWRCEHWIIDAEHVTFERGRETAARPSQPPWRRPSSPTASACADTAYRTTPTRTPAADGRGASFGRSTRTRRPTWPRRSTVRTSTRPVRDAGVEGAVGDAHRGGAEGLRVHACPRDIELPGTQHVLGGFLFPVSISNEPGYAAAAKACGDHRGSRAGRSATG